MKKFKGFVVGSLVACSLLSLTACGGSKEGGKASNKDVKVPTVEELLVESNFDYGNRATVVIKMDCSAGIPNEETGEVEVQDIMSNVSTLSSYDGVQYCTTSTSVSMFGQSETVECDYYFDGDKYYTEQLDGSWCVGTEMYTDTGVTVSDGGITTGEFDISAFQNGEVQPYEKGSDYFVVECEYSDETTTEPMDIVLYFDIETNKIEKIELDFNESSSGIDMIMDCELVFSECTEEIVIPQDIIDNATPYTIDGLDY